MAHKTGKARIKTPSCIVEIPLVVPPADEHFLLASVHSSTRLYNAALWESLKRLNAMKQSTTWSQARILKDKTTRKNTFNALIQHYRFESDSISAFATRCKNNGKMTSRVGSAICQKIAERAFQATKEHCYGKRGRPRFKSEKRKLHSIEGQTNITKTGIKYCANLGCVQYQDLTLPCLFQNFAETYHNQFDEVMDPETGEITLAPRLKHAYLSEMLQFKTKYCRLIWKMLNGKRRWFVQLIQQGVPPLRETTKIPESAKGAVVGLDIGPSTIAIVDEKTSWTKPVKFCAKLQRLEQEIRRIQRAMERSKRKTNPECY